MRKNFRFGIMCILVAILAPQVSQGQNGQMLVVVQKRHFQPTKDFNFNEWRAAEKEYFDKVTAKNELIQRSNVLVHYYTPDNSEVLFVTLYNSWEDIDKAVARSSELGRAGWPDSLKRRASMDKLRDYYTSVHSDEIYATVPALNIKPADTSAHVFYVRQSHLSFPKDGKNAEVIGGLNEHFDNVMAKNELLKGYYAYTHRYGSDSRDFIEVFVYNSLTDMENAVTTNTELEKKYWPDEKKGQEAFDKVARYFEPWHGDLIYRSLGGFQK